MPLSIRNGLRSAATLLVVATTLSSSFGQSVTDDLKNVGITLTAAGGDNPRQANGNTLVEVTVDAGSIAAQAGIGTSGQVLVFRRTFVSSIDDDPERRKVLTAIQQVLVEDGADGQYDLLVASAGSPSATKRVIVPTLDSIRRTGRTFGLTFSGTGASNAAVTVATVSGIATQADLREGDVVVKINNVAVKGKHEKVAAYLLHVALVLETGRCALQVHPVGKPEPENVRFVTIPSETVSAVGVTRGIPTGDAGPHVAFPEFLNVGGTVADKPSSRTLRNEVVTARVELYYFRDAHRVAQIINRKVKSYNAPAVTLRERAASDARDAFEIAKSRRRELEFRAEQKGKELRQKRKELGELVNQVRQQLNPDIQAQNRSTLTQLEDQRVNLLIQIRNVDRQIADIDRQLVYGNLTLPTEVNTAATRKTDAGTGVEQATNKLTAVRKELDEALKRLNAAPDKQTTELEKIKVDTLRDSVNDALKKLTEARKELDEATKALTELQAKVTVFDRNKTSLENTKIRVEDTKTNLNNRLRGVNARIRQLNPAAVLPAVEGGEEAEAADNGNDPQGPQPDGDTTMQTLVSLTNDVRRLEGEVADAVLKARQAEEKEQIAAKEQFRREVSAAKTDPNTYVPGELTSRDPVTQVSISVIGEGVIHLRGPRQGVVEIREMINQLDHPVGQVKLGVMTVQINGEDGARMDNTLRRMEGHLSRGRFLTYVSEQLFRRSVAEVAAIVAEQWRRSFDAQWRAENGGNAELLSNYSRRGATQEDIVRWESYITAFFGTDFLRGIKEVYNSSAVIDPINKLIGLSSADTLTLAEAMIVLSLAKADVREAILFRFQHYLLNELPQLDANWVKTNRIKKGWDFRSWDGSLGSESTIKKNAVKRYRFDALTTLFKRDYTQLCGPWDIGEMPVDVSPMGAARQHADQLNPFQREIIKLVQGITVEQTLRTQRDALIYKRAYVEKAGQRQLNAAEKYLVDTRIDLMTERHLDAVDALRGRKAAIDHMIKQAVISLEDDVYAQFYNPALERIRASTQEWDVELGSVERSTILTNNRAFAKVAPQATFQFDLPKRDIALVEAMKAAYALQKDLGPFVADPQFGTLTKMFAGQSVSGASVDGTIKNVLPGMSDTADQESLLFADTTTPQRFGTELEKLIPDPAIYKFETGTGFQVRPVVQPDGQSVVFDFNYMYTTDLLEPTAPDEKKLGRVKRHFVDTEVQLGNLEWREISRYEVSLKAARNSRGVPLLEDVPIIGLLGRPLPQAQKSIQKNIIIGQAAIYPTIQDLLGLRPASAARFDLAGIGNDIDTAFDNGQDAEDHVDGILEWYRQNISLPSGVPAPVDTQPQGGGGSGVTVPGPAPSPLPRLPAVPQSALEHGVRRAAPATTTSDGYGRTKPQPISGIQRVSNED